MQVGFYKYVIIQMKKKKKNNNLVFFFSLSLNRTLLELISIHIGCNWFLWEINHPTKIISASLLNIQFYHFFFFLSKSLSIVLENRLNFLLVSIDFEKLVISLWSVIHKDVYLPDIKMRIFGRPYFVRLKLI